MKRKMLSIGIVLVCLFVFCGCGGNQTTLENNIESASDINSNINIEDIDWFVKEGLIEKEKAIVFGYTNNTEYPLLEVEMRFEQKEGLKSKQLAVFDEIKEEMQWTDEEVSEAYLIGRTEKIVEPGETVEISKCSVNGFWKLDDMAIYNLMEPSSISIDYIDSDKIKNVYYDFKLKQYSQSYDENDTQEWTTNSIFSILPKCEARVVRVNYDYGNSFSAKAYGITKDDFKNYINACKDKGLSNVKSEFDTLYDAESNDGYSLMLGYTPIKNQMSINLSAPEMATPAPTAAPTPTPAPTAPPAAIAEPAVKNETSTAKDSVNADFKAALDEYEKFFDDYVDFIKKYEKSDGSDLSLISDYASYISKYTDMMNKLDELGKKDMTADEAAYFLEVQARITKKLAEVAE